MSGSTTLDLLTRVHQYVADVSPKLIHSWGKSKEIESSWIFLADSQNLSFSSPSINPILIFLPLTYIIPSYVFSIWNKPNSWVQEEHLYMNVLKWVFQPFLMLVTSKSNQSPLQIKSKRYYSNHLMMWITNSFLRWTKKDSFAFYRVNYQFWLQLSDLGYFTSHLWI